MMQNRRQMLDGQQLPDTGRPRTKGKSIAGRFAFLLPIDDLPE